MLSVYWLLHVCTLLLAMSALGSFLISWRGAFGPPGSKTTVGLLFFLFPMLPHLRPTDGLRSRWNAGVFGAGLPSAFSLAKAIYYTRCPLKKGLLLLQQLELATIILSIIA